MLELLNALTKEDVAGCAFAVSNLRPVLELALLLVVKLRLPISNTAPSGRSRHKAFEWWRPWIPDYLGSAKKKRPTERVATLGATGPARGKGKGQRRARAKGSPKAKASTCGEPLPWALLLRLALEPARRGSRAVRFASCRLRQALFCLCKALPASPRAFNRLMRRRCGPKSRKQPELLRRLQTHI